MSIREILVIALLFIAMFFIESITFQWFAANVGVPILLMIVVYFLARNYGGGNLAESVRDGQLLIYALGVMASAYYDIKRINYTCSIGKYDFCIPNLSQVASISINSILFFGVFTAVFAGAAVNNSLSGGGDKGDRLLRTCVYLCSLTVGIVIISRLWTGAI